MKQSKRDEEATKKEKIMPHDQSRSMKRLGLTSKDLNLHRRTFRDLNKLRIQDNTDVLAERVLQKAIKTTSNSLKQLNIMIRNVDNRVTRLQNKQFVDEMAYLIAEQDAMDVHIKSYQTKIAHLRSQIERVDVQLEKYSTNDDQFNADHKIQVLEDRLFHSNQKMSCLRQEGIQRKNIVSDLMYRRRRFQIDRDNVIATLKRKKQEILELVDHYSIGFANGMKNWQDIDLCRTKTASILKNHLQEMRHLIRTAETNDILQEFMITKATPIEMESVAVPQREILKQNFSASSKICVDQLKQIDEYAPNVTPGDLLYKRRETFALYLFENEIVENIEDIDRSVTSTNQAAEVAKEQIQQRTNDAKHLAELKQTKRENNEKQLKLEEHAAERNSQLRKYMKEVHDLYKALKCDTLFGFKDSEKVDEFNLDEVLQIIEIRLRQVMYSVFCWQENQNVHVDKRFVHGVEFDIPRDVPRIELINPCPECSQVEARASVEVENIVNQEEKFEKLRDGIEQRTMTSQMHHIEECPRPGSKAVITKDI